MKEEPQPTLDQRMVRVEETLTVLARVLRDTLDDVRRRREVLSQGRAQIDHIDTKGARV